MRFIIGPLAVKYIPVHMIKNPATVRLIVLPFTFVAGAIRPGLLAKTVAETTKPLATIHGSVLKGIFPFLTLLLQL